ncbi:hypothetical protein [Kribbella catacumbae]|uniref:hypothetical protein n=1 Tax=Kribbella catacumbae TaxID=460086 RepID=UPI000381D10F|nr:hypothetical protein [Kribbella catacumbae]
MFPGLAITVANAPAHPITQRYDLPVSPFITGCITAALVLLVALAWPGVRRGPRAGAPPMVESWRDELPALAVISRLLTVLLLGVAITAGRLGADDDLENLAPALVVGVAWPVLVLASILLGPVWRWADPWDSTARVLTRGQPGDGTGSVRPAAVLALPWLWYLSAYQYPLAPRSVGLMLAVYSLLTVAGCLAVGRVRWLSTCEPLGIGLAWMARLPRGRLADWDPPRGATALLGVLAGGTLFAAVRRSEIWAAPNSAQQATLLATLGLLASCAVATCAIWWMAAAAGRRSVRAAAARAVVPAVAGIIVAVAMDRNRLTTSLQLLPGLLGDPFGLGWDLLGEPGAGLNPAPLGITGLIATQVAVVTAGHLAGAIGLSRSVRPVERAPVALGLSLLCGASVVALASH